MRYENQISIYSGSKRCHRQSILPLVLTMIPAEELLQRLAKFIF